MEDKAINPPGVGKKKTTPLNQARGTGNMVQAPPRPTEPDTNPQINIELDDLKELARINPLAWEQLIHIADNRRNAERIAELEGRVDAET